MERREVITVGITYIASDWLMDALLCYVPGSLDWLLLAASKAIFILWAVWKWRGKR